MIKSKKERFRAKGNIPEIMAEYSIITTGVINTLVDSGFEREEAVKAVEESHRIGTLTKQELEKEVNTIIAETMMNIARKISGSNEDGGESDE